MCSYAGRAGAGGPDHAASPSLSDLLPPSSRQGLTSICRRDSGTLQRKQKGRQRIGRPTFPACASASMRCSRDSGLRRRPALPASAAAPPLPPAAAPGGRAARTGGCAGCVGSPAPAPPWLPPWRLAAAPGAWAGAGGGLAAPLTEPAGAAAGPPPAGPGAARSGCPRLARPSGRPRPGAGAARAAAPAACQRPPQQALAPRRTWTPPCRRRWRRRRCRRRPGPAPPCAVPQRS